jgi:hypothetical protein
MALRASSRAKYDRQLCPGLASRRVAKFKASPYRGSVLEIVFLLGAGHGEFCI